MMMLHEIQMKKLQQKVYSGKVQEKKNALAEKARKEALVKMQADADAEHEKAMVLHSQAPFEDEAHGVR